MNVVKAPASWDHSALRPVVFLAGSIEMGAAEPWQARLENALSPLAGTLLNPRRDDWDASWVQSIANPPFREQVEWELRGLRAANIVAIYFDPATKSPITLLELGLMAGHGYVGDGVTTVVCCPDGFWRKGNVEIVCAGYHLELFDHIDSFTVALARVILEHERTS